MRFSRCNFAAWIVERHAIQQHQRAGVIGAAREHFRQRPGRAIFVDLQAGNLAQHVEDHRELARFQPLPGDHVSGDGGLLGRGFGAVRGDHNGFHAARDRKRDLGVGCGGQS